MRQFIAESSLDNRGCLLVEGKKFHYLSSVLRCSPGDMIDVRLPEGELQQMTVASVDVSGKKIILQVAGQNVKTGVTKSDFSQEVEFFLFQFAAKPPKMELILRQAVECGVSGFIPVNGTFCQKSSVESACKKSDGKDERWNRIVTEARQQSGSPVSTKIFNCLKVQDAVRLWKEKTSSLKDEEKLAVVLYEQTQETKALHEAAESENIKAACIVCGAEGGITPEEIDLFKENGFIPVHFNTNILRCETAALYGMAALQSVLMEKNLWQKK
ncbi:MAG: 16S rRNA (uracil(1498)-N(3))-methyltransferase [Treponema sp.]|nr:RsmE family RNA methyltransferase [Spirochaetia bacterium]MDD7014665.1 16S rRNA (uracil(1498)-N(3))-methyltransferase [Spirochaetales bacterium]MDY4902459.1 16S rRNA (uracil(1498)-N(3))-methyltransferase [Treponema sp.]